MNMETTKMKESVKMEDEKDKMDCNTNRKLTFNLD